MLKKIFSSVVFLFIFSQWILCANAVSFEPIPYAPESAVSEKLPYFGGRDEYLISKDGKVGIYTKDSQKIIDAKYDKLLFRTIEKNNRYYYFSIDDEVIVVNQDNKEIAKLSYRPEQVSLIDVELRYAKVEKDSKYLLFDPDKNKLSFSTYNDFDIAQGKSLVFMRNDLYLQYKKGKMNFNIDKSITPVRILLLPVELPIALIHDLGEAMLVVGTVGLWEVFFGTDWWLTGKGAQGLP